MWAADARDSSKGRRNQRPRRPSLARGSGRRRVGQNRAEGRPDEATDSPRARAESSATLPSVGGSSARRPDHRPAGRSDYLTEPSPVSLRRPRKFRRSLPAIKSTLVRHETPLRLVVHKQRSLRAIKHTYRRRRPGASCHVRSRLIVPSDHAAACSVACQADAAIRSRLIVPSDHRPISGQRCGDAPAAGSVGHGITRRLGA